MAVAGPTPHAAFQVIHIVEKKVWQGLLSQVPPELRLPGNLNLASEFRYSWLKLHKIEPGSWLDVTGYAFYSEPLIQGSVLH